MPIDFYSSANPPSFMLPTDSLFSYGRSFGQILGQIHLGRAEQSSIVKDIGNKQKRGHDFT